MERYDPQVIEPKWQQRWEETGIYRAVRDPSRPKFYFLTMFPYPSGDLHMGHWFAMAPSDAVARYLRMKGYNVLFPIGFDAFGLPAENAAIKHNTHPKTWTYANIERMRRQLRSMGASFDWTREVVTCEPEYYKWNQWFFIQFFKRGLAYRKRSAVDFCPKCNTTLAREQVVSEDGERVCERCGTPVIKKELEQWFLRITAYAEELLDHSRLDWPERVCTMQKNWIGRSEGAEIVFPTEGEESIVVFTTRPDTLFGATFMVLAPEHPLVPKLTAPDRRKEVEAYIQEAQRRTEIERLSLEREKTGVFIGAYARHPLTEERLPIWISDYVLMEYGTGAIMGVPAHDQRDFEFAVKFQLPIRVVIAPPDWKGEPLSAAYEGPGTMVNSGPFDGLPSEEGKRAVTAELERRGLGRPAISYRLRDWCISRQRYWGTPIPIIYCPTCGMVPVPEDQLPVLLPESVNVLPTGESPLKYLEDFVKTTCPQCGGPAERETDTMDTFVDSSWYQYRYLSPHKEDAPWDEEEARYWLPVDLYTGGVEHATMHLLYTRFWTKVLRDMGMVWFDEPMIRLRNQGVILGEDREKMSKSRGNVVAPDELVMRYGADTVRAYLMFGFRWDMGGPWSSTGIEGVHRWLHRVWNLVLEPASVEGIPTPEQVAALRRWTHRTIQRVSRDLEDFEFNTAIAALMEFTNYLQDAKDTPVVHHEAWDEAIRTLTLLLAPFAPHLAEELWERLGYPYSVHQQPWPQWDEELAKADTITLVIQINGRVRDRVDVPASITEEEARRIALDRANVRRHLGDRQPQRIIYVPGRLINIVVE
ncbi:leucine--tRNA ligase [Thermoflexus sp.]|uniref:leucine--tRNA ligase n=1 Tax=Thermoflexus sp. TaxID=1969742 RepID=UPI002ADE8BC1|nr:leucine--tRNA ligase [Thermoflexus sp.]